MSAVPPAARNRTGFAVFTEKPDRLPGSALGCRSSSSIIASGTKPKSWCAQSWPLRVKRDDARSSSSIITRRPIRSCTGCAPAKASLRRWRQNRGFVRSTRVASSSREIGSCYNPDTTEETPRRRLAFSNEALEPRTPASSASTCSSDALPPAVPVADLGDRASCRRALGEYHTLRTQARCRVDWVTRLLLPWCGVASAIWAASSRFLPLLRGPRFVPACARERDWSFMSRTAVVHHHPLHLAAGAGGAAKPW